MLGAIHDKLRVEAAEIGAASGMGEGEIVKKFRVKPKVKRPRRKPSISNKSNKTDYSQKYMQEYRSDGKDFQKAPEDVKKWRTEQRKRLRKKMHLKEAFKDLTGNTTTNDTPSYQFDIICGKDAL